jgi:hypothetical protein
MKKAPSERELSREARLREPANDKISDIQKAVIRKQKPLLCKERWRAERVGVVVALSLIAKIHRYVT